MPRSDEAEWWFNAVYAAVQEIPRGRVTSYGHIATLLGCPQRPRQVGICLKHLPAFNAAEPDAAFYNARNVPWQRVVNAKGGISPRGPGSAERQAVALRREGVTVSRGVMGEFSVDFGEYGWFPNVLPSERLEDEDEDEDEAEDQGGDQNQSSGRGRRRGHDRNRNRNRAGDGVAQRNQ